MFIPKRPNFVVVSGQVYNPAAISYVPGRDLVWYLRKAGGATPTGDKKEIYVLHADGSVVPRGNNWISNNFMNLRMRPGDTIFVPEKIVGGSTVWQNVAAVAQAMAAAALPIAIIGSLLTEYREFLRVASRVRPNCGVIYAPAGSGTKTARHLLASFQRER